MFRFCVLFLLLTFGGFALQANAQNIQTKAREIRAAMEARDFDRAESLTRELRAANPQAFAANNYDYLLGRLAERKGSYAEAQAHYMAVLNRGSILAPYALWHLATLARATGDFATERQHLTRLTVSFPSSVAARKARDRMVNSLRDSGEFRATIPLLRPLASTSGVAGRKALAQLGEAYLKTGDAQTARTYFDQLTNTRDDYALAACEGLDQIDANAPNEFEALRRARIYLTNRHWAEARKHLLYIVNNFPQSQNRAEALYQIGFAFYREDNYPDAIKWFEQAYQEFPQKKEGSEGYYFVATALQKAQRYDEAARRYIDFISAYPDSDRIEGAYRNIVDSFRYAGKYEEAIQWTRKMGEVYANKPLQTVAVYNEARIEMARGRWEVALTLLTRLQALPAVPKVAGGNISGETNFLRVLAIEQLGRLAEAARLYLAIPDDRDNYFGQRATARLKMLAATKEGRSIIGALLNDYRAQAKSALAAGRYLEAKNAASQALRLTGDENTVRDLLTVLRASYNNLASYNSVWKYRLIPVGRSILSAGERGDATNAGLAAELLFFGLYDEGVTELRLGGFSAMQKSAMTDASSTLADANAPLAPPVNGAMKSVVAASSTASQVSGDYSFSMAVYSNRGDQSNYAIGYAEPLFGSVPKDYRVELMPRDLIELMYPAPYKDAFNAYAPKLNVDPRLILGLARQESRFNPAVKSHAAARGLLQFIAETAEKLANEEKLNGFELDDVYEPEIAVRLAARYVYDLQTLFPNNSQAIAASYNSGEQGVERWIFRAKSSDVDRLFAEIALPETKDYVAKVLCNYRAYEQLFTKELKPRK
ncbi:MAG: tetratricopeptide repeat protein [Acidobacteriota bacterium]